jgi:hypothetical protein
MEELLKEIRRCLLVMYETNELPRDICPADLIHLINEKLGE